MGKDIEEQDDYNNYIYDDLKPFINQDATEQHYDKIKAEVKAWLIAFVNRQRKLSKTNKEAKQRLLELAEDGSYTGVCKFCSYMAGIDEIADRQKNIAMKYVQQIEWLPEGETIGRIDGILVCRTVPYLTPEMRNELLTILGLNQNEEEE